MIKTVRVTPIEINTDNEQTFTRVIVEIDAAQLAKLYEKNGIDPATITVPYVTVTDGVYDTEDINLKEAVDTRHVVNGFAAINFGFVDEG